MGRLEGAEGDAALSATVNEILQSEVARRRRAAALAALLDCLDAEQGPVEPQEVEELRHPVR